MQTYITTESGNVISRTAQIKGSRYVVLAGKSLIESGASVAGDASKDGNPVISLGRYVVLDKNSSLRPPERDGKVYPLKIGSYVYVGENAAIEAASIGSNVVIGAGAKVGRLAVIKDCAFVAPGTVVPPFAVVPPMSLASGPVGRVESELPESAANEIELFCRKRLAGIRTEPPRRVLGRLVDQP